MDDQKSNLHHRMIGQFIDNESMQFLDQLVNLPVQRKVSKNSFNSGPPLLKAWVRYVDVQMMKELAKDGKKKNN